MNVSTAALNSDLSHSHMEYSPVFGLNTRCLLSLSQEKFSKQEVCLQL